MSFWTKLFRNRSTSSSNEVKFVREERHTQMGMPVVKEIYSAPSRAAAMTFLRNHPIDRPFFYIEIDTPEGRVGRDIDSMYDKDGELKDEPASSQVYFENVFKTVYLEHNGHDLFAELNETPTVSDTKMFRGVFQTFFQSRGKIVGNLRQAEKTVQPESACYHDSHPESHTCLIVTALPWQTTDVPVRLAAYSKNADGYMTLLKTVLGQRPDPKLTHWVHVLICMVDGRLHAAAGAYDREKVYLYPKVLLNENERKLQ